MSEHSAKIVADYKSQSQELREKTPSGTNNHDKKEAHQLILYSKGKNQRKLLKNNFGNEKNL